MTVSILHRITGGALTVVGLAVLTWWLMAAAGTSEKYAGFVSVLNSRPAGIPIILIALIGLTWALLQHTLSGIRHLIMDTGENFELRANKTGAIATIVVSIMLTAALWFYILGVAK